MDQDFVISQILDIPSNNLPTVDGQLSDQTSPISALEWLNTSHLVVALRNGKVCLLDIANRDEQQPNETDVCITYQKYNSIWDIKVIDEKNIAIACDSGHVYLLTSKDEQQKTPWTCSVITHVVR